ncbi:MAG: hypothetical protein ACRDPC_10560 [Solirubrobacteraceae bacterium]
MIRLACELPATSGVPLARWSTRELAAEAVTRGIAEQISGVTVWRWLSDDAIKPWQHRSWIFPRDPNFAPNAYPLAWSASSSGAVAAEGAILDL